MTSHHAIRLTSALLLSLAAPSYGAGFQLAERSASGLGRAFSGEAAIADDASVIASNPAGMILLGGDWSYSAGITGIFPDLDVQGAFSAGGPPVPAIGNDIADDAYIPFLYIAKRINDSISVGFGSYTTYGLKTNYPVSFSARTVADFSELKTVNLNPSIAWRINDSFTLGAGFDALRAEGKLTTTIPNTLPAFDLAGDDWGYGFNLGVLYELSDATRFGLHYRSSVDLKLDGRAVSVIPGLNSTGTLGIELPDSIEFSAYHEINDQWAIHGDVVWTKWSTFDQLQPYLSNGAPVPATPENWDDVFRYSIGTTFKATECLTFRAGVAYDESPVPDAFRTLRIPDEDRIWLSLGLSWQFHESMRLDVGYTHIFSDDMRILDGGATTGVFNGTASGSVDLVSIGVAGEF